MMKEATFIEEWLEEARQEAAEQGLQQGLQQGVQQGAQQGAQNTLWRDLLRILRWRFSTVPASLEDRLARLTAEQLDPLVNQALEARGLDAFIAAVG